MTTEGCWAKVDRAEEVLVTLQSELGKWFSIVPQEGTYASPYKIRKDYYADPHHRFDFIVEEVAAPSDHLGVIFGEYVHDLRSALDQLVWALAVNNKRGKEPANANATGFPVADNLPAFLDAEVLKALTFEQITVLEKCQPYHAGDAPQALSDLNTFWNEDKHRLVLPVTVRLAASPTYEMVNVGPLRLESYWWEDKRPLKPNTKIAGVVVEPSAPHPDVNIKMLPLDVAFGKTRRIRWADIPRMAAVVKNILDSCRPFFP